MSKRKPIASTRKRSRNAKSTMLRTTLLSLDGAREFQGVLHYLIARRKTAERILIAVWRRLTAMNFVAAKQFLADPAENPVFVVEPQNSRRRDRPLG